MLDIAQSTGWTHAEAVFDGGTIICDLFASEVGEIRALWLATEWTPSGRFSGAVFFDRREGRERNAWSLGGARNSLESFLRQAPAGASISRRAHS
ncbi:MAG TPA: hypothetical protein VFZ68_18360 [Acidimicrobiales bacterium]